MISALRKLIAFVFLLGIFWYTYRDIENLQSFRFISSVCSLFLVFALFWFFVPRLVVRVRVFLRKRRNRLGYAEWLSAHPEGKISPLRRNRKLNIAKDEQVFHQEKGTMYLKDGTPYDSISVPCQIGDVAFPKEKRHWRKIQRTHCYFTSERILFLGKEIDCDIAHKDIRGIRLAPGGLVFTVLLNAVDTDIAFTFHNPLVISAILNAIKTGLIEQN